MPKSLLNKIRDAELTSDQRRIAELLTSNLHRVAFLSGAELASECGVSVSAITRFAQRLGYKGFPALKRELEQLYRETTTPYEMFESFRREGAKESVALASIKRDLQNIESMQAHLDLEELERVVSLTAAASKVHLVAIASAESLVALMHAYLEALKKPTQRHEGFGLTKRAELMDFAPDELMIGFSFQRVLREVRDLFRMARSFGVPTVAITDSPLNALAAEADVVLLAPVIGTTFGLSHAAPVVLVNALINSLAALDEEASARALQEAKAEWERRPVFCESRQGETDEDA